MKTSVEQISANKFRLSVEVPASDLQRFLDRTYRRLAEDMRVPGFRPGRVPKPIIDKRLGRDFVRNEALRDALPELFQSAIEESELRIVAPPEIDVTSFEDGTDLTFDATVETRPTPELKDYTGLKVARPDDDVSDEEVDEQIERLRVRLAPIEVVERPASEGDFAQIDLTTTHDDIQVDALTTKDLLVEVGTVMLVPELDAELVGKRRGDILKLSVTLPDRFGEHAGRNVQMQVLVKDVKARKLRDLDDSFAADSSEFATMDELRAEIRTRLEEAKRVQSDATVRERVLDAFVDEAVDVELPEGMVTMEVDHQLEQLARALAARGASFQQYLEHEDLDIDAARQRFRPQAERNLTAQLGLEALIAAEGLTVSEAERDEEISKLAERLGQEAGEVRAMLSERGDDASLDDDILRSRALDLLVERAEITKEGPE
jgi:trigger factor